ncbi:MAG: CBS domain-containing protein [Planctomycetes bacterium]|nr:CBS domain-containing protein [Planctomycetota bacterium]
MEDAAELMVRHEISGAPVIDELGRCVGILSGYDFAVRERAGCGKTEPPRRQAEHVLVRNQPNEPYHIEDVREDMVRNYMTSAVQTIDISATLMQAARAMCGAHVHRLIVLDDRGRPAGIVSSLDVVAALLSVVTE